MSKEKRNISVIKDAEGNKIVMINDIIFKGKRKVESEKQCERKESFGRAPWYFSMPSD